MRVRTRYLAVTGVLLLLFFILVAANVATGSVKTTPGDIFNSGTIGYDIFWKVRLPRMTAGIILGGALALSGFMLQTFSTIQSRVRLCWGFHRAQSSLLRSSW